VSFQFLKSNLLISFSDFRGDRSSRQFTEWLSGELHFPGQRGWHRLFLQSDRSSRRSHRRDRLLQHERNLPCRPRAGSFVGRNCRSVAGSSTRKSAEKTVSSCTRSRRCSRRTGARSHFLTSNSNYKCISCYCFTWAWSKFPWVKVKKTSFFLVGGG